MIHSPSGVFQRYAMRRVDCRRWRESCDDLLPDKDADLLTKVDRMLSMLRCPYRSNYHQADFERN